MKYKILDSKDLGSLEKLVNECIFDGWTPLGGVSVNWAENDDWLNTIYAQAMIKIDAPDECNQEKADKI